MPSSPVTPGQPRTTCPASPQVSGAGARRGLWAVVASGALAGCPATRPSEGTATQANPSPSAAHAAPLAGEKIDIPGGAFFAGSTPGESGRLPALEPRRYEVELGPYQIDRLFFPNDPSEAAKTGVTRPEAQRLCAERGSRLCTELEWERACKGPASQDFSGGSQFEHACAKDAGKCASGFDVVGMGDTIREWTASDVVPESSDLPRRAAVRGAAAAEGASLHRCARRQGIDPETRATDLGFRCCTGAPNGAVIPEPRLQQTFRKVTLTAGRLEQLLLSDPRTEPLARDAKSFREPEAAETVVSRGGDDRKGFLFTVAPLLWNPAAGVEYLVIVGRSGERTSFVLAYYALGADRYDLASSFVMQNEPGPVALAYSGYIRPRLHFSTCWGCPGETGKILFRDPESVVIVQP